MPLKFAIKNTLIGTYGGLGYVKKVFIVFFLPTKEEIWRRVYTKVSFQD